MSRIAFVGVLAAGAVLTIVGLHGAASEASAAAEHRVCVAGWCPKERPSWGSPVPRGDEPPTSTRPSTWTKPSTTTSTTTSTYTKTTSSTTSTTTTSTTTTSTTTTTTTVPSTTTVSSTSTTPPVSTTTTTTTTTTKPPSSTPVRKPPRHQDNRLANTGVTVGWLVPVGALLVIAGGLLLWLDRSRRASRR